MAETYIRARRALGGATVHAMVFDMRRAAYAVSITELAPSMASIAHGGLVDLPTALIVAPDVEQEARNYAWEMAKLGFCRGIFTDAVAAECWITRKAAAMAMAGGRPYQIPRAAPEAHEPGGASTRPLSLE